MIGVALVERYDWNRIAWHDEISNDDRNNPPYVHEEFSTLKFNYTCDRPLGVEGAKTDFGGDGVNSSGS